MKKPTRLSAILGVIGFSGNSNMEVFSSMVTAPAALAAGIVAPPPCPPKPAGAAAPAALNVLTLLISVLIG